MKILKISCKKATVVDEAVGEIVVEEYNADIRETS